LSIQNIADLQDDAYNRLLADEVLAQVFIQNERKGDILNSIVSALGTLNERGGKIGAAIVVLSPTGSIEFTEAVESPLKVRLAFRVLEDPVFNTSADGTRLSALTIVKRIIRLFHLYNPIGMGNPFLPEQPTFVPVEDPVAPVAYEIRFSTTETCNENLVRVPTPSINPSDIPVPVMEVFIECSDEDAEIYYTVDGTHPWPGNPNSVLYTLPISVTQPLKLRACAFRSGMIASDVQMSEFTEPN